MTPDPRLRLLGYWVHPVASWFPLLDGPELQALAADIRQNGLLEPIVTWNGQIIDGRNRLAACELAGVDPETREWGGTEAELVPWILSKNLHRRHLDVSQRAMIAARLATLSHGGDRSSGQLAACSTPTQAGAAALLNVGERTVRRAREVLEHGTPELVAAVESGEVTVSAAAREVRSAWFPPQPDPAAPPAGELENSIDPDDPALQGHLAWEEEDDTDEEEALVVVAPDPTPLPLDERAAGDAYWTPDATALACVRWLSQTVGFDATARAVEPSVGGGAWVRALRAVAPDVTIDRIDLDRSSPGLTADLRLADQQCPGEWLGIERWRGAPVADSWELCVGNPPYGGDLVRWLEVSLERARVVAYLLRETVTGSMERLPWWLSHRPAWVAKVLPRPRWEGPGQRETSDYSDHVLVVWVRGETDTRWDWIDASVPR